jgi:hypothetical protein
MIVASMTEMVTMPRLTAGAGGLSAASLRIGAADVGPDGEALVGSDAVAPGAGELASFADVGLNRMSTWGPWTARPAPSNPMHARYGPGAILSSRRRLRRP